MQKNGPPLSYPVYPGPGTQDDTPGYSGFTYPGGSGIVTADQGSPPEYDSIFSQTNPNPLRLTDNPYLQDDRNLWEKLHEWFEMSILQQIIWLVALAFSISYISYGLKYDGGCSWKVFNNNSEVVEGEDLPSFIQIEGGILCSAILYVFLCRFRTLLESRRTERQSRNEFEGKKNCDWLLFIINFGVCVIGATKVFHFYDEKNFTELKEKNEMYTMKCNTDFYSFYYNAKIIELVVLISYTLYIFIVMIFIPCLKKRWFLRRKWRQWVRLLDADQDGVISADDMERTNAKLEQIRRRVGDRTNPLSAEEQEKWWNEYIYKGVSGKSIAMSDYVFWLESSAPPHDMASKLKPMVTEFFNFFSTEDFRNKNIIMSEEDFVKFWAILAGVDKCHCREIFAKHFPSPLTMALFLEDFVAFLSHHASWNEYSHRVFNVLKYKDTRCCRV